uniref:Rho-GAP domain-containing protein n=1 Tax=Saimiri boliviensis boliviensis TaxID=39432 RepID=A0A2K6SLJ3_SAIBB
MDTTMLNMWNLFEQLVRQAEIPCDGNELQFIQLRTDHELGKYKDLLMKAETEKSALDVKLKQAAEADCGKMLMCDTSGSKSEEQKSALGFLNTGQPSSSNAGNKRLSTIDESRSILSSISFDKTDESLDWDSSLVKTFKLKEREKRHSSSQHFADGSSGPVKKTRSIGSTADQSNESTVAETTVTVPNSGGPIKAVSAIETVPYWARSQRKTGTLQPGNSDSTLNSRQLEPRTETDSNNGGMHLHDFVSKTVIKPESCVPCGKWIKFDCCVVSHPECQDRCPLPFIPDLIGTPVKTGEGMLADFVSQTSPMIPSPIVVHYVNESTGPYSISGCDCTVKEPKEKFLRVKTVPLLSKVDGILANCKPLLTFHLNKAFMEAAEITDEDNSIASMYQAVAFLMIHLQRVAQSPHTKMDVANRAKIFGPTIVAHSVPDPDSVTMLQDIKRQPKVGEHLLSLPLEYWSQFMMMEQENIYPLHVIENSNTFSTPQTPDIKVSLLGPVTTLECQLLKTPSSSSLKNTPRFGSKSSFFASPMLK